jgi:AbrB family looped-hinge helix DNA binding protein
MLITVDKRGGVILPAVLRRELGLREGTHLNLEVLEGGAMMLQPVAIYPGIRLNENGLSRLSDARESGTGKMPDWLIKDMDNARSDTE